MEDTELRGEAPPRTFCGLRRIEIILFVLTLFTFAFFYQASDHNTAARFDLIRAILEKHQLRIDAYCGYNTADLIHLNGHYFSNKAPGGSLTGIVPWLISRIIAAPVRSVSPDLYWALVTYFATILTDSLAVAIMVILVYRLALFFGCSRGRGVALALILALGTIMFPHATEFAGEPIAAACVTASFYLLVTYDGRADFWPGLVAGGLAGWAGLCDYPSILISIVLAAYGLWRLRGRDLLGFIFGAVLVAMLLLAYDKAAFGNPFFLSYEAYMLPGSDRFAAQARGFAGVTYPRWNVLYEVFLAPQRGLFFCNPVLLLTIPGLYFFWRRREFRPEFYVIAASIILFALVNGSYGDSVVYWGGGTATGPRHMLTVIPFMVLALCYLPNRWNYACGALAFVSVFLMLLATAVEPHFPYEYDNPLRDFAWPAFLRGDLAYNQSAYYGGGNVVGDSVAFNLGKLLGLAGWIQLWPLAAVWIGGAIALLRQIDSGIRKQPAAEFAVALAIAMMFAPPAFHGLAHFAEPTTTHGLLGRYYRGLHAGISPPHIVRVDPTVDFDSVAELGALPSPTVVVWSGSIEAPVNGIYRFQMPADDSAWLKIDNRTVIADPGESVTRFEQSGSISLTRGEHLIEAYQRNIWGGASVHLMWQTPGAGDPETVPALVLTPAPE